MSSCCTYPPGMPKYISKKNCFKYNQTSPNIFQYIYIYTQIYSNRPNGFKHIFNYIQICVPVYRNVSIHPKHVQTYFKYIPCCSNVSNYFKYIHIFKYSQMYFKSQIYFKCAPNPKYTQHMFEYIHWDKHTSRLRGTPKPPNPILLYPPVPDKTIRDHRE